MTKQQLELIVAAIANNNAKEDIGFEHVDCGAGACPIDFSEGEKEAA